MCIKNNKKKILLIILPITILIIGYFFYHHSDDKRFTTAEVKIEKTEIARLKLDGSDLKILTSTNDYSTSRNFIFLDTKTNETVTTLSVSSLGLWAPQYRIVKGSKHDWLVVTRVDNWGTGMRSVNDDWYVLGWRNSMKLVMSYPSETMLLDASDNKNTYWKAEVINSSYSDDSTVDVKFYRKTCSINEDKSDGSCVDWSNNLKYLWNSDKEEFVSNELSLKQILVDSRVLKLVIK